MGPTDVAEKSNITAKKKRRRGKRRRWVRKRAIQTLPLYGVLLVLLLSCAQLQCLGVKWTNV